MLRPFALVLAATATGLALGGCVSLGAAPAGLAPAECAPAPELAGTWESRRTGRLGPSAMAFDLGCDCSYRVQARAAVVRFRERGAWWTEGGRLLLSRASGEVTEWPFELRGDRLVLEEHPGETHEYRRTAAARCAGTAAPAPTATSAPSGSAEVPSPAVPPGPTTAEVLAAAGPEDWRPLEPANTLYVTLPGGRVVIELAPDFAPRHVENVRRLARQRYWDGLAVVRSQDNYVVQWGDPAAGEEGARPLGEVRPLPPEWDRPLPETEAELPFTPLGGPDVYAPEAGFVRGLPAVRDREAGRLGLAHCYGMVGAGRDLAPDSASAAELYVVIGHAPRHLDRNVTLLGRVVDGMEVLSTLPRGTGPLGFYETPDERVPILSARLGSDLPPAERADLELLRTDTDTFRALVESRRWRREEWFADPVGAVELCNVPLPGRERPADGPAPDVGGEEPKPR